jgi:hypothetical protein
MTVQDLAVGQTVTFETVPNLSYLSTDKLYRVEWIDKHEVYFRSRSGSGTSERKVMLSCDGVSFYQASC